MRGTGKGTDGRGQGRRPWRLPARALLLTTAAALTGGTFLAARPSHASGFLIYDLSGNALARASAVSATVEEPAAVWFNPAALAFGKGVKASAGGVFVSAKSRFSSSETGNETSSDRGNFVLPTLFASAIINERVAVGMGV